MNSYFDKIVCVGKNYLEHAKELGDAIPEKPVLFLKPPSVLSIAKQGEILHLPFPERTNDLHHECEIVIQVGPSQSIAKVSLGLDMTKRDLQSKLKKNGHPWTISKVFAHSAIVGPMISPFSGWEETEFFLSVSNTIRQKGRATQMILSVHECLKHASSFFPLCEGDLLFTGTPAGVAAINKGDRADLKWGSLSYSVSWI